MSAIPAMRKSHPGSGLKNGSETRTSENRQNAPIELRNPRSGGRWWFCDGIHRIKDLPQLSTHCRRAPKEVELDPPVASLDEALSGENEGRIGQDERARIEGAVDVGIPGQMDGLRHKGALLMARELNLGGLTSLSPTTRRGRLR